MPEAIFNVRHFEEKPLHLAGEVPLAELDIESADELVHPSGPLEYDLTAEKLDNGILVQGELSLPLRCECARCLKAFQQRLSMPNWACHLALEGEEAVQVANDVVDLTPYIREDILLAFPQHPLCEPECKGLPNPWKETAAEQSGKDSSSSTWSELNKLKLK